MKYITESPVIIGSGNGLALKGDKPLLESVMTQFPEN